MRRVFNFVLGAGLGALAGAALAILLAPSSGEELRGEMRDRFSRFRSEIEEAARERRSELERQLQGMRHPQAEIPLEEK